MSRQHDWQMMKLHGGKCVQCGRKAIRYEISRRYCPECLERHRQGQRVRRAKNRGKEEVMG